MIGKLKQRRTDVEDRRKPAPRFQVVTTNKLSAVRVGDRVAYRDQMGRERVGTVSRLDLAHGAVTVRAAHGIQRVIPQNFLRIEARTARSILEREE